MAPLDVSPTAITGDGSERDRMFPRLTAEQLERLAARGTIRQFPAGQVVIESGVPLEHFYAVLHGEIEIVRPSNAGEERIVVHTDGEFVGDVHTLSGRRSVVRARARTETSTIELARE